MGKERQRKAKQPKLVIVHLKLCFSIHLQGKQNRQLGRTNIAESLLLNETNSHYFCTCLVIVTSRVNANALQLILVFSNHIKLNQNLDLEYYPC